MIPVPREFVDFSWTSSVHGSVKPVGAQDGIHSSTIAAVIGGDLSEETPNLRREPEQGVVKSLVDRGDHNRATRAPLDKVRWAY